MESCDHLHMGNAVKLFLTYCNTGIDHETHYLSNIKCCNCGEGCDFIVQKWDYVDGYLDLKVILANPLYIKNKKLTKILYRHYPIWLHDLVNNKGCMSVKEISSEILKVMPNRLTQWVLHSYMKGNMYTDMTVISDPLEFVDLFWHSLCGYTRKIIQKRKRMVWL